MNTVTKLITYATASNSGTFAGHPYDLYVTCEIINDLINEAVI